jgi:hypothetical protein
MTPLIADARYHATVRAFVHIGGTIFHVCKRRREIERMHREKVCIRKQARRPRERRF